jgi:tRNA G18 (ribose-2'-O)-methylase SpoU
MCALEVGGVYITKKELPKKKVLVFGTERDGISQELSAMAEQHVALPMREGVSSLNLASSVTAVLYRDIHR